MSWTRLVPFVTFPSSPVQLNRPAPEVLAPTASTFFAIAGLSIEQPSKLNPPPLLPAAKMSRFSGFCWQAFQGAKQAGERAEAGVMLGEYATMPFSFEIAIRRGWELLCRKRYLPKLLHIVLYLAPGMF